MENIFWAYYGLNTLIYLYTMPTWSVEIAVNSKLSFIELQSYVEN